MREKTIEQKFLDAFKSQYKNDFEYNEYPNEHIRMWFMNGYELAQKELHKELDEAIELIEGLVKSEEYATRGEYIEVWEKARDFLKERGE